LSKNLAGQLWDWPRQTKKNDRILIRVSRNSQFRHLELTPIRPEGSMRLPRPSEKIATNPRLSQTEVYRFSKLPSSYGKLPNLTVSDNINAFRQSGIPNG